MIETNKKLNGKNISIYKDINIEPDYPKWNDLSPVIVGFGPAGMLAALYLARCDAKPIIIERGSKIEDRKKDVEEFFKNKKLNINSNVQFGEGGAGAFSDGKLVTNVKDPLIKFILNELLFKVIGQFADSNAFLLHRVAIADSYCRRSLFNAFKVISHAVRRADFIMTTICFTDISTIF